MSRTQYGTNGCQKKWPDSSDTLKLWKRLERAPIKTPAVDPVVKTCEMWARILPYSILQEPAEGAPGWLINHLSGKPLCHFFDNYW